jgi:hypothetical protein
MRRKGAPDARGQGGPRMRDRDVRVLGLSTTGDDARGTGRRAMSMGAAMIVMMMMFMTTALVAAMTEVARDGVARARGG